jgi:hypothetical protein
MAITVKHTKVSTIPDGDDSSLIRPSDWNADHQLVGTVPPANGGTGATTLTGYVKGNGTSTMTASSTIPNTDITGLGTASTKDAGIANGVATLDGSGTVPISQLPSAVIGALSYQGTWNANTNTPTLTSSVGTKGYYYVVNVAGSTNLNGITDWQVGDWAVYNGSTWQKIDNTDAVTSVNGKTGTVVLTNTDISGFGTMSTQNANSVAITGGTIDGTTIGGTTPAVITGTTINANTKVVSPDYYAQSVLGGNLRTSGGTSLVNWDGGGSGNVTINGGLLANPANKNVSIAPTGTGTATINPATAGTIDNMVIGATTPKAITGTTITATTFSGSGSGLTSIPNSALVNSAITINGVSTSLGGSVSVGTVTSVSGTAGRITSTGGTTPVIDLASGIATAGTTGSSTLIPVVTIDTYGRVTGITTASNPQGTVTSVTGTAPVVSSGGATPAISMAAANTTTNGYLTSTDWNTFNGKQPAGTYVNSVSGTTNQITASTVSGAVTVSLPTSVTTGQYIGNASITGSSNQGAFAYGTLGYSDVNHILTMASSQNSYIQMEIQNTNAGAAASSDVIVGNNNTTASTYYGDFGMNSGGWAGTGAFTAPNNVYLTATSGDLAIGTTTNNQIRFAVNGGTTDALTIATTGAVTTPNQLTGATVRASNGIVVNAKSIAASYSIASGDNAMSVGPVTVATGQSVTIASGSRWVVL